MPAKEEILQFIARFAGSIETFTSGCCFWFAHILAERFRGHAEIVLAVVENHFVARIDGRLYDVTGDVTEEYKDSVLVAWDKMDEYDSLQKERIVRDCVLL